MGRITRIFLSGLLALLPLIVTMAVFGWAIAFLYQYLGPESWLGRQLISLGSSFGSSPATPYLIGSGAMLLTIFLLGLVLESRLGSWLQDGIESGVSRIPVIGSVYDLSKRFTSILDTKSGNMQNMRTVWCFFGGEPGAAVLALMPSSVPVVIGKETYLGVLIPSAPVPVGGALIYVPEAWIREAEDGVDDLMAIYVSMGVTPPKSGGMAGWKAKA